jgi:hypothetical protein
MLKTSCVDALRRALALLSLSVAAASMPIPVATAAGAAPVAVEPFDGATWQALQAGMTKPAAVVFTATYCAVCPAALETMRRELRARRPDATLIAVVIDAAPGDPALARHAHYRAADRVYAFAAPAAQVQHAVNPRWRGITPSVALLAPGARLAWSTGVPPVDALQAWAAAR